VIGHTMNLVSTQADARNLKILWNKPSCDFTINGDREKLIQIIINLLVNAIQASPSGGSIRIRCGLEKRGKQNYTFISISDDGPGIPEDLKEKIFNPFFTTKEQGTGLGLSITSRIADEHRGFIEVSNIPPHGADFRVFFPSQV